MRLPIEPERSRPAPAAARRAVLVAALLATAFTAGTVAAPLLDGGGSPWAGALKLVYAPLCHQRAERCLPVGGSSQAVCARCAGLYLGATLGLFLAWGLAARSRLAPRPWWLAASVSPTLLDVGAGVAGLPALPELPRMLSALPAGGVAALFLAAGIVDLFTPSRARGGVPGAAGAARPLEETDA